MRRALAVIAALALALDGPAAHAGGYGYSSYGYSYPNYSYPSYANYYNNNYYYPVQPVVVQQNLIPAYVFQSAAALTPPVQTSTTVTTTRQTATTTTTAAATQAAVATTGATVATGASLAAVGGAQATQAAAVRVDSAALEDRIAAKVVAQLQSSAAPAGDEPPTLQSAPEPAPDFSLAPEHETVLRNACAKCHGGAAPKAHLSLFDAAGSWSPSYTDGRQGDRGTIYEAVSGNPAAMPKGGAPLPADVVEALRLWAGAN